MTFINRERIVLLESRFHFQIEFCNVPTVALFQIRNGDWFITDIWQIVQGVCKTRNTPGTPRNTPEHPRNTPGTPPEQPGTARNSLA